jgi:hypothetical protein
MDVVSLIVRPLFTTAAFDIGFNDSEAHVKTNE